jgi:hypothetical protein
LPARREGTFFQIWRAPLRIGKRARLSAGEPGEPLGNHCINKCSNIIMDVLRYVESITAQGREHVIDRMLSVKKLPHVDADRAQAKPTTAIRVEENGPIVKLLPELDVRVRYGFFAVFHRTDTGSLSFEQYLCHERHHRGRRLGSRVRRAFIH